MNGELLRFVITPAPPLGAAMVVDVVPVALLDKVLSKSSSWPFHRSKSILSILGEVVVVVGVALLVSCCCCCWLGGTGVVVVVLVAALARSTLS